LTLQQQMEKEIVSRQLHSHLNKPLDWIKEDLNELNLTGLKTVL
jgi:hypothetical protein